MLTDLAQGRDVAAVAVAVDQQGADAGRLGAQDVLLGRVTDVQRLLRSAAGELEGRREDRGVGLARPGDRRADRAVEQIAQAAALEHPWQRAVPVRDRDEALAPVPESPQRR